MNILLVDFANTAYMGILATVNVTDAMNYVVDYLDRICTHFQTERIVLFHDGMPPRWRNDYFPDYKQHRQEKPELQKNRERVQAEVPALKALVRALGHIYIEVPGVEADDLIGLAVYRLRHYAPNCRMIVASTDHDYFSLLDYADVYHPRKGTYPAELVTREAFFAEYGVNPPEWPHVKALMGDASDNYKGLAGIGEKKALQAVQSGVRAHTPREQWPDAYKAGKWQQDTIPDLPTALYIMSIPLHESQLPETVRDGTVKALDAGLYRVLGSVLPDVPQDRRDAFNLIGPNSQFQAMFKKKAVCWLA